jgi:VIT1/CCC1 family predicted Fe2+/Mn2+ transporter
MSFRPALARRIGFMTSLIAHGARDGGEAMEPIVRGRTFGVLDPVDRISEILFGLIMAVTIVGSLSIATAGAQEVRTVMISALGCNVAWGLVDAVMHLIRTMTERSHNRVLARRIARADDATADRLFRDAMPDHLAPLAAPQEVDAMRRRLLGLSFESRPLLRGGDFVYALGIFFVVVIATFPVVTPFLLTDDLPRALSWSRAITLVMLFLAGVALGHYAGYPRPLFTGIAMGVFGAVLIAAVKALGG